MKGYKLKIDFTDLVTVLEDIMEKKKGMKTIEVNLTDEEFIMIAKKAHENDITFNQQCNKILEECMKNNKK